MRKYRMKKLIIGIGKKEVGEPLLNEKEQHLLSKPYIGGVLLLRYNMPTPQILKDLIAAIKCIRSENHCDDEVFYFSADFECQNVWRAPYKTEPLWTEEVMIKPYASMIELGKEYDLAESPQEKKILLDKYEKYAYTLGENLKDLGININLAPVADSHHENSPIIAKYGRAISSCPDTIYLISQAMLKGFKKAGLHTHLKHFPDHGYSMQDSHTNYATDDRDEDVLMKHCQIYEQLIQDGLVDSVMMSHVLYDKVDKLCVASRSEKWHKILRNDVKFRGDVLSDCMVMKGAGEEDMLGKITSAHDAGIDYVILASDIPSVEKLDEYFNSTSYVSNILSR